MNNATTGAEFGAMTLDEMAVVVGGDDHYVTVLGQNWGVYLGYGAAMLKAFLHGYDRPDGSIVRDLL